MHSWDDFQFNAFQFRRRVILCYKFFEIHSLFGDAIIDSEHCFVRRGSQYIQ